jgi:formylglycine-generating enzyme required for sulfatase activity
MWYRRACRLGQKEGCNSVERLSKPSGARRSFRVKGATFAMRWIPAGSFRMGSAENEPNRSSSEGPQRSVTISKGYWMLESEVTQGQYKALMGSNPSYFSSCGDNCPVEGVSWHDARAFAEKLSEAQGLAACTATDRGIFDCKGWRLPTEAEWEYAARAGTTTAFHTGDCISTNQANYDGNYPQQGCAKGEYRNGTIEVCSLARNAWGLCDMHGNVWEWVMDWYKGDSYKDASKENPLELLENAPSELSHRVVRGGGWGSGSGNVRSARRSGYAPAERYNVVGFRLLRSP